MKKITYITFSAVLKNPNVDIFGVTVRQRCLVCILREGGVPRVYTPNEHRLHRLNVILGFWRNVVPGVTHTTTGPVVSYSL